MAELEIYAKPSNLFRYRPLGPHAAREIDAIKDGYIFCPSFADMNDPMEGSYRLSTSFVRNPHYVKRQESVKEAFDTMGIASLSEVYDHEPMWAHYADQFRGMCVQYSLNRLLRGLGSDIAITRMMYSEREPVLLSDGSTPEDRAKLCLSSKTVRWASEREWRIFRTNRGQAGYKGLDAVTKIYLGSRITHEDEQLVLSAADNLNIPVAKMTVDAYALRFENIQKAKRSLVRP